MASHNVWQYERLFSFRILKMVSNSYNHDTKQSDENSNLPFHSHLREVPEGRRDSVMMPFPSQEIHGQPQPMEVYVTIPGDKRVFAMRNESNSKKSQG